MTFEDKRKNPRHAVALTVDVTRDDQTVRGTTQNVSLGGLKLTVDLQPPPRVGERLWLHLDLPTLPQPIDAKAEVRWMSGDGRVLGVQFVTGLRAKEIWALGRFLDGMAKAS